MEQRKLTELEVSEKLCDIACKIQQTRFFHDGSKGGFSESYDLWINAHEALMQNLISLVKEVRFENLTYFQKKIAQNSYKALKSTTITRTSRYTIEESILESILCEQLEKG